MKTVKCENCKSDRFKIIARGFCGRCYRLTRRLDVVNKWDVNNSKTLIDYPVFKGSCDEKYFNKIKTGIIEQITNRLVYLNYNEQKLNNDIYGSDLVPRLQRIAKLSGSRNKNFLWHQEDLFDHNFTPKQKKLLFKILNEITESIPWRGINWDQIYNK